MSIIVIEGPDNSGKSTLASYLAAALGMRIQESEGKPRDEHELEDRCKRYGIMTNTLFVRHPVISNPIYCHIHGNPGPSQLARGLFYGRQPLLIYCDPQDRGLDGHVLKETDTEEFLTGLAQSYDGVLVNYRTWALQYAHVMYRIGDGYELIEKFCRAYRG